ncbi:MAG: hypothetical protein LBG06_12855 [Deltaproteobacteria bacterium]|jgi:hypothetical protein|nr:hypothetical protein [Deltaproteobacteria bacterium]
MKVDPNRIAEAVFLRPQNETPAARAQKAGSADFADLLKQGPGASSGPQGAMELLSGTRSSGEDRGTAAEFLTRNSLSRLQLSVLKADSASSSAPASASEAAEKIEETLALLEQYAVSLGDPGNSLKDLSPLAEGLSVSSGGLDSLAKGLPEGDPLRELGAETAALAAVEALKFKRGDFL